jgi:hypothetical protein
MMMSDIVKFPRWYGLALAVSWFILGFLVGWIFSISKIGT